MEKYNSVLKFNNYIVNEIKYKTNKEFKGSDEGTTININIVPKIDIKDNNMSITLITNIFSNALENNYPFEMQIDITGDFSTEGDSPDKFVRNAIAILYPYVRAIVSTYTSSANISPLILPAINVNKLIENQEKKD